MTDDGCESEWMNGQMDEWSMDGWVGGLMVG